MVGTWPPSALLIAAKNRQTIIHRRHRSVSSVHKACGRVELMVWLPPLRLASQQAKVASKLSATKRSEKSVPPLNKTNHKPAAASLGRKDHFLLALQIHSFRSVMMFCRFRRILLRWLRAVARLAGQRRASWQLAQTKAANVSA